MKNDLIGISTFVFFHLDSPLRKANFKGVSNRVFLTRLLASAKLSQVSA